MRQRTTRGGDDMGEETTRGGDYTEKGDYAGRGLEKGYKNRGDIHKEGTCTEKRHTPRRNY